MATAATEVPTLLSTSEDFQETIDSKEIYEKQAKQLFEEISNLCDDDDGDGDESWTIEAKTKNELDIVTTKTIPNRGKIFRLTSIVNCSPTEIVKILFEDQEKMPEWSPTVNECRILEVIHSDLFITYQMTNEQAQGLISKRDFVNITARQYEENRTILAAQACLYSSMPPRDNCVRAENGITAYLIEKIDEQTVKLIWILNVDLKGWLPQYLINTSLANVQLNFIESLRLYLSK